MVRTLVLKLIDVVKSESAVFVGAAATAVVALAAKYNVVIDEASLEAVLSPLVTGAIVRFFVTPAEQIGF